MTAISGGQLRSLKVAFWRRNSEGTRSEVESAAELWDRPQMEERRH